MAFNPGNKVTIIPSLSLGRNGIYTIESSTIYDKRTAYFLKEEPGLFFEYELVPAKSLIAKQWLRLT